MIPISPAYQQQQLQNIQAQIAQLSQLLGQQSVTPNLYSGVQSPISNIQQTPAQILPTQQIQSVNGLEGAKAFQLAPNSSAILMDTNEDVFYCVSTDANGVRAPIKIGRFTLEDEPSDSHSYVTRKDFDELKSDIKKLLSEKNYKTTQKVNESHELSTRNDV